MEFSLSKFSLEFPLVSLCLRSLLRFSIGDLSFKGPDYRLTGPYSDAVRSIDGASSACRDSIQALLALRASSAIALNLKNFQLMKSKLLISPCCSLKAEPIVTMASIFEFSDCQAESSKFSAISYSLSFDRNLFAQASVFNPFECAL